MPTFATLLFLWQVPHFWLLFLSRGDEYERAGLPVPTNRLSRAAVARITFAWILATAAAAPLAAIGARAGVGATMVLGLGALWLGVRGRHILRESAVRADFRRAFWQINLFGLGATLTLSIAAVLGR